MWVKDLLVGEILRDKRGKLYKILEIMVDPQVWFPGIAGIRMVELDYQSREGLSFWTNSCEIHDIYQRGE